MSRKNRTWTDRWANPEVRQKMLDSRKRPLAERLAKFRIVKDDEECWGWSGTNNGVGYGYLRIDKRLRLATHVALEVDNRPMPDGGACALHSCDNPPCTNPKHLRWGTFAENTQDALDRNRMKRVNGQFRKY